MKLPIAGFICSKEKFVKSRAREIVYIQKLRRLSVSARIMILLILTGEIKINGIGEKIIMIKVKNLSVTIQNEIVKIVHNNAHNITKTNTNTNTNPNTNPNTKNNNP